MSREHVTALARVHGGDCHRTRMHHRNLWLLSGGAFARTRALTLLSLASIPHPLLVAPVTDTPCQDLCRGVSVLSDHKNMNGVRTGQQTRKENVNRKKNMN